MGASHDDLKDVYEKQIRSILEFGVPVWNGAITKQQVQDIERVQKTFLRIVLGQEYQSYDNALEILKMDTLVSRRKKLCETFAVRAANDPKFSKWFKINDNQLATNTERFCTPEARLNRYRTSPIPYLTRLLNNIPN